jgi:hypothetical protein
MLNDLKLMLGIAADETDLDEKLKLILRQTSQRLEVKLGGIAPPPELEYIILEVSIIRFNRIGSEGLSGHTVEGENQTFRDSDFEGYTDEIQDWLSSQKTTSKGKVRFL